MLPTSASGASFWPRGSRCCLLVLLLVGAHLARFEAAEDPALYIVGPNDVLVITVYDQPQLTRNYPVQADGTLTFPLIGRVRVGGLSMPAIENQLRERLAGGFLKNPQVTVAVEQYRSQQIFVMGEVRTPGSLQFTGSMSVIEALARAGSITDRASLEALIVRPPIGEQAPDLAALLKDQQSGDAEVIRIDIESLQKGALTQNITLRGGDTIFVPRADTVFVSGHVNGAGEYNIRKGMTVRQVLALAGGVTERGSTGRIQVIRKVDGKDRTVGADLQDLVQPGDTIVVRERFF